MSADLLAYAKLMKTGDIFKAATLLHEVGLQSEPPNVTIQRWVKMNPDMCGFVSRHPDGKLPPTAGGKHED